MRSTVSLIADARAIALAWLALLTVIALVIALVLPASAVAQSTQPTQVPLRADIVAASEVSNTAIEVREGRFGRLGAPEKGFCEYGFDTKGTPSVRDSTGSYGPGIATPDGCIAPDTAEMPRFDLICASGEQFTFRINTLQGTANVALAVGQISAEGALVERLGERLRLTCTARTGLVTLTVAATLTLTPDSRLGAGDLGAFELDSSF